MPPADRNGTFPAWPSATSSCCSPWCSRAYAAPSCVCSTGATSSLTGASRCYSSAAEKVVSLGGSRSLRASRVSCGGWPSAHNPEPTDPVFCGLQGGRLQQTILADIIGRAARRAGIEKHVTAHTLRHTAATWLRQKFGDTRLVAEYLGHADLSTVARYAHVDREELFDAADLLEKLVARRDEPRAPPSVGPAPGSTPAIQAPTSSESMVERDAPERRRRRRRHGRHRR